MFCYQVIQSITAIYIHCAFNSVIQKHLSNACIVPDNVTSLGDILSQEVYKPEQ